MKKKIKCPSCGKLSEWNKNNPFRPFCSERCRLIDLGEWANESHRIPNDTSSDTPTDTFNDVPSDYVNDDSSS